MNADMDCTQTTMSCLLCRWASQAKPSGHERCAKPCCCAHNWALLITMSASKACQGACMASTTSASGTVRYCGPAVLAPAAAPSAAACAAPPVPPAEPLPAAAHAQLPLGRPRTLSPRWLSAAGGARLLGACRAHSSTVNPMHHHTSCVHGSFCSRQLPGAK